MTKPQPKPCSECARLERQRQAAYLANDRSRLTDLTVLQRRHDAVEHVQEAAPQRERAG
jgi:hypothetical protein